MTERTSLYNGLAKALTIFDEENRAVLIHEFQFLRGEDEKFETLSEAYIQVRGGRSGGDLKRWLWSNRKRNGMDMRRAGAALDAATLVDMDPTMANLVAAEYLAATVAEGWERPAAPATIGQEPCLPVALAAGASHRALRTVQTKMRSACRAELLGQGVLPGVPAASEVYKARMLGVGHG